ncbi:MAG: hypothetical protein HQL70_08765 [Magnetococcales bacterium]|nr:hypothetical protein [Magnetococcales bacterium]
MLLHFDHPLGFWQTFSKDRYFLLGALGAGIASFLFLSLAWDVDFGVDANNYIRYYFHYDVLIMQLRTFLVSEIVGQISELESVTAFAAILLCFYLLTVVSVYYVARLFGKLVARVTTILFLLHFDVTVLSHYLASDNLNILAIALWSMLLIRLHKSTKFYAFILLGISTFALVLIRTPGTAFILMSAFPVVLYGFSRVNIKNSLIFLFAFLVCYYGYSYNNYRTYGKFQLVSLSDVVYPGMHVFRNDFFHKENGPNSKELFRLVEEELLVRPMYKDRNIDSKIFFTRSDMRMWNDLVFIDWVLAPGIIARASYEAILADPISYMASIIKKTYYMLIRPYNQSMPRISQPASKNKTAQMEKSEADSVSNHNSADPTKRFIPYSSTAEGQERLNKFHHTNRIMSAEEIKRRAEIDAIVETRLNRIRPEPGNYHVAHFAKNVMFYIIPPLPFFLILSLFSLPLLKKPEIRLIWMLLSSAMVIIMASAMLRYSMIRYRLPFDFIIILIGTVGVMGNRTICSWFIGIQPEPKQLKPDDQETLILENVDETSKA